MQRVTIDVACAEVKTSWKDSCLILEDYKDGKVIKRVKIKIDTPYIAKYLQGRIDEINEYWKSCL